MTKSKRKSSKVNLIVDVIEILIMATLICTLAMSSFSYTTTLTVLGNTSKSISLYSMTEFIGDIFNGNVTNAWAIIGMITYFLSLLLALVVLLFAVLDMFGVRLKKLPKYALPVLLCIFVGLTLLMTIIFANFQTQSDAFKFTNTVMAISWAPIIAMICGAGSVVVKMLEK